VGNPLCDPRQYSHIISDFIHWLKDTKKLKPIWILVDNRVEEVLGGRLGWSSLTCAAEERVNDPVEYNGDVQRKIRHAKAEGLSVSEVEPTQDLRRKCDEGIKEWLSNQIHLTNINPWLDTEHRRYFVAQDTSSHKVHALVVLAQLSSEHDYQVKCSLDFPGAPNGAIEYLITEALKAVQESGARSITFGAATSSTFSPMSNLKGIRVKMLSHM
jgi:aspartyl-tRNA synthetase